MLMRVMCVTRCDSFKDLQGLVAELLQEGIFYLNVIRFLTCKPLQIVKPSGKQACRSLFINIENVVFPTHIFVQMKSDWNEYQG